jgi:hypothetical protein
VAFRKVILASIAVIWFGNVASAQGLSPSDSVDQLDAIQTRMVQYQRDIAGMSRGQTDCDVLRTNDDVYLAATLATEEIQAVQGVLAIYAFIPATTDKTKARTYLVGELSGYRRLLTVNIDGLNLALGQSFTPASLAVLGTRLRDDMRAVIAILERTDLR